MATQPLRFQYCSSAGCCSWIGTNKKKGVNLYKLKDWKCKNCRQKKNGPFVLRHCDNCGYTGNHPEDDAKCPECINNPMWAHEECLKQWKKANEKKFNELEKWLKKNTELGDVVGDLQNLLNPNDLGKTFVN